MSAGGWPIHGSRGQCYLWSSRKSLLEFGYLFFWHDCSAPVLQSVMTHTEYMCGLLTGVACSYATEVLLSWRQKHGSGGGHEEAVDWVFGDLM